MSVASVTKPCPVSAPAPASRLPLTAALIAAGVEGLSLCTPGHRGGRLFGVRPSAGADGMAGAGADPNDEVAD